MNKNSIYFKYIKELKRNKQKFRGESYIFIILLRPALRGQGDRLKWYLKGNNTKQERREVWGREGNTKIECGDHGGWGERLHDSNLLLAVVDCRKINMVGYSGGSSV